MLVPMTRAAFRENPAGGYVSGEHWLYFGIDLDLFGYAIWGRPTADDIERLTVLLVEELERPLHDAIVELGSLDSVAPDAFEALATYTTRHRDELAKVVRHTAIVRPAGMVGAIVSGFLQVAGQPFPVSFHATLDEALSQIGRDPSLSAHIASARADVAQLPAFLVALRAILARNLIDASLGLAATDLGLSLRTLQRRLTEHDTTFEAEVQRARIAAACRLLVETDAPITRIALDVGFKASQHFAVLFARHTGRTPTEFRAARRVPRDQ